MLWAAEKDLLKSAQDFFENGLLHKIIMQNRCCNACFLSISVHYAVSISNIKGMWGLIEDASERDRFTVLCGNVAKFTGHMYTLQDDSALKPTRIQDPSYIVSIISRHMDVKLNESVSTSHLRLTSEMDWRGQTAEIFQKEKQMRCHLSQRVSSPKCHTRRDGSEMLNPPQKNRRRRRNRNNPHTAVAVPQSAHSTGHTHTHSRSDHSLALHRNPTVCESVNVCVCVCVCMCEHWGRLAFRVDGYLALLHASCWLGCRFQASVPDLGSRTPLPGCPPHPPCIWYALQNYATKDR